MLLIVLPNNHDNNDSDLLVYHIAIMTMLHFDWLAIENKAEPTIDLIYRFTEEYGMPDATPISFKQLTDRLVVRHIAVTIATI